MLSTACYHVQRQPRSPQWQGCSGTPVSCKPSPLSTSLAPPMVSVDPGHIGVSDLFSHYNDDGATPDEVCTSVPSAAESLMVTHKPTCTASCLLQTRGDDNDGFASIGDSHSPPAEQPQRSRPAHSVASSSKSALHLLHHRAIMSDAQVSVSARVFR